MTGQLCAHVLYDTINLYIFGCILKLDCGLFGDQLAECSVTCDLSYFVTISDENILKNTRQAVPFPHHRVQCCIAGSKKYRKKTRHHCSHTETGEVGRAFFWECQETFGWDRIVPLALRHKLKKQNIPEFLLRVSSHFLTSIEVLL